MLTEQCHTAVFFPTLVRLQRSGERHLVRFLKKMTALGLQPFLIYPAVIKLRHKGEQRSYDPLRKRRILSAPCLSRSRMPQLCGGDNGGAAAAVSPARREGCDGRDGLGPSCPGGDDGRMNTLAKPIFCVFFSPLSYWDIVLIYPVQRSLCW